MNFDSYLVVFVAVCNTMATSHYSLKQSFAKSSSRAVNKKNFTSSLFYFATLLQLPKDLLYIVLRGDA